MPFFMRGKFVPFPSLLLAVKLREVSVTSESP